MSVRDTGEGIDPQTLPHLFERFRRGPAGGFGLGLSIVREIAELQGATIDVESQSKDPVTAGSSTGPLGSEMPEQVAVRQLVARFPQHLAFEPAVDAQVEQRLADLHQIPKRTASFD